ncbi:MAG: DUF4215 domain-containing protein, partial [Thermodesulfovibrionia bacterium]|nr:DUF4215 domain-containing protein [Thermodesulfovibrionia bacterium]
VGSDGTVGSSEECKAGETIACTSFSSGGWTGGTAVCARDDHWDTSTCGIISTPPGSPGGYAPSAFCGNGTKTSDEECDDGNKVSGDGCSSTCTIEHMAAEEEREEERIQQICGNNILEEGEECDDGNTINGDGCDTLCKLEKEEEYDIDIDLLEIFEEEKEAIVKITTEDIADKLKALSISYEFDDPILLYLESLTCEEVGCISECPDTLSPSLRLALDQPLFGRDKICDTFICMIKIKHLLYLIILLIIIVMGLMGRKIYNLTSHKKRKKRQV